MPTVNEELFDRTVRHQIFVSRLSVGTANRMVALMNATDADLVRQIRELDPTQGAQRQRLERLLLAIREVNDETKRQVKAAQSAELTETATHEIDFQMRLMEDVVGEVVTFDRPSPTQIRAAALASPFQGPLLRWATQGAHVDETFRRRLKQVSQEIRKGVVEGESIDAIVRRIRGTRQNQFKDGILELSRRDAHSVARTSVNAITNRANVIFAQENDDIIKGYQWIAILDGRTTAVCRGRSGKIWPVDGVGRVPGIPADRVGRPPGIILTQPPAHVNCRSTKLLLTKSFRELGIDADEAPGLEGDIPDDPSYNDWLRTQPREFVEDVLGVTKAQLYLNGNLTLDKFIDSRGKELTISQLRTKEMSAFEKAGLAA